MSTERQLGDRWAGKLRREGYFVQKIPASSVAGFPDWLVVDRGAGIQLVEAKKRLPGVVAFRLTQLTGAQRWILDQIARRAEHSAFVLVLAEDGFAVVRYGILAKAGSMSEKQFNRRKEPYDAKS